MNISPINTTAHLFSMLSDGAFPIAELNTSGPKAPLIIAFFGTLIFFAMLSGTISYWRSPNRVQNLLASDGVGLLQVRKKFSLGFTDILTGVGLAFIITAALTVASFYSLHRDIFVGQPWWTTIVYACWTETNPLGAGYRPIPLGILGAVFLGIAIGRSTGISIGRYLGAKSVLITSRIHRPAQL